MIPESPDPGINRRAKARHGRTAGNDPGDPGAGVDPRIRFAGGHDSMRASDASGMMKDPGCIVIDAPLRDLSGISVRLDYARARIVMAPGVNPREV